jgi:L-lactate dehydrogenase complex protein LldG
MSSREIMLDRIRTALGPQPADSGDGIERRYRRHADEPRAAILAQFAERVAEYRATIRRVEGRDLPGALADAFRARGLRSLVVPGDIPEEWLPQGVEILKDAPDAPLTNEQLDRSGGVLTGCAAGIAQTGTIVLDGGSHQGRRAITLLPDYHLCVVFEEQVVGLVPEAIALLAHTVRRTARPITFISGPSATSDIELNRVEGVHGPRMLEVLLVRGEEDG